MERTEYWIRLGQGKAIALIHGTGKEDPHAYWQDFLSVLMHDEKLHEFGVFVWKYPTHVQPSFIRNAFSTMKRKTLRETAPRIALLGSAWNTTYHTQFQGYQDILLVCHSMGGLVVKSWILDTLEQGQSTRLTKLCHVAFYATPHQGAPVTTLAQWNKQLKDMQLDSPFIEDVDRLWYDHVVAWKGRIPGLADERFNRYIPHLVLAGLNDAVVPSQYATIRGMPLTPITGDHSQVIQPIDSNDTRYKVWRIHLDEMFKMISPKTNVSSPLDRQMRNAIDEEKKQIENQQVVQRQVVDNHNRITSHFDDTIRRPALARPSQPSSAHLGASFPEVQNPISVYLSYIDKDEPLLRKLEVHLSLLKRQGLISIWHNRQIVPGTDRAREIDERLEQASIILLLVSADFLASDYCYEVEIQRALERHEAGEAKLIPIAIRPADWKNAPFAHLQPLPTDAKAITSWRHQDEAFLNVAEGIRKVVEELLNDDTEEGKQTFEIQHHTQEKNKTTRFGDPFPPVWNVPYRYAAFFTGRDGMLEQLFTHFTSQHGGGMVPTQALTGVVLQKCWWYGKLCCIQEQ